MADLSKYSKVSTTRALWVANDQGDMLDAIVLDMNTEALLSVLKEGLLIQNSSYFYKKSPVVLAAIVESAQPAHQALLAMLIYLDMASLPFNDVRTSDYDDALIGVSSELICGVVMRCLANCPTAGYRAELAELAELYGVVKRGGSCEIRQVVRDFLEVETSLTLPYVKVDVVDISRLLKHSKRSCYFINERLLAGAQRWLQATFK